MAPFNLRKIATLDKIVGTYCPCWNLDFKDETYAKIDFLFKDDITASDLTEFFDGKMTDQSKNRWYPKLVMGTHRNMRVLGGRKHKYPIFVVSKGRFEPKLWRSSTRLSQMSVNHYLVVEPQEFEIYSKNFNNPFVKIIPMDLEYKKFYMVNCYTPNSKRGLERLEYRQVWEDDFRNYLNELNDYIKSIE